MINVILSTHSMMSRFLPKNIISLMEEYREELMTNKPGAIRFLNQQIKAEKLDVKVVRLYTVQKSGECAWVVHV